MKRQTQLYSPTISADEHPDLQQEMAGALEEIAKDWPFRIVRGSSAWKKPSTVRG